MDNLMIAICLAAFILVVVFVAEWRVSRWSKIVSGTAARSHADLAEVMMRQQIEQTKLMRRLVEVVAAKQMPMEPAYAESETVS